MGLGGNRRKGAGGANELGEKTFHVCSIIFRMSPGVLTM